LFGVGRGVGFGKSEGREDSVDLGLVFGFEVGRFFGDDAELHFVFIVLVVLELSVFVVVDSLQKLKFGSISLLSRYVSIFLLVIIFDFFI
jgi:hypothetical protein